MQGALLSATSSSDQHGGGGEAEGDVQDGGLHHLPALLEVAQQDGEGDDSHAGEGAAPNDLAMVGARVLLTSASTSDLTLL